MPNDKISVLEALTNQDLGPLTRTIYAWILACKQPSVTIIEVADAMGLHRATAGTHLNSLREHRLVERFLAAGNDKTHHWRLTTGA